MASFGNDPIGSKDEVREDCCCIRTLSMVRHRGRKQQLVAAKR